MLAHQPVALAGVTREHLSLRLEDAGDIDVKVDRHGPSVAIAALDGLNEVEVGDLRQRRRGLPLPGRVVGA